MTLIFVVKWIFPLSVGLIVVIDTYLLQGTVGPNQEMAQMFFVYSKIALIITEKYVVKEVLKGWHPCNSYNGALYSDLTNLLMSNTNIGLLYLWLSALTIETVISQKAVAWIVLRYRSLKPFVGCTHYYAGNTADI